jgi:hypothetical protein
MNKNVKITLITIGAIIVAAGAIAYGALTAPQPPKPVVAQTPSLTKTQLDQELQAELPTITSVITGVYPKVASDYTINKGQLFDKGEWYGTTLSYHGSDTLNRDTLRVLLQKKQNVWIMRTTPPVPLLSAELLPDVPKSVLKTINQPVSLP